MIDMPDCPDCSGRGGDAICWCEGTGKFREPPGAAEWLERGELAYLRGLIADDRAKRARVDAMVTRLNGTTPP